MLAVKSKLLISFETVSLVKSNISFGLLLLLLLFVLFNEEVLSPPTPDCCIPLKQKKITLLSNLKIVLYNVFLLTHKFNFFVSFIHSLTQSLCKQKHTKKYNNYRYYYDLVFFSTNPHPHLRFHT